MHFKSKTITFMALISIALISINSVLFAGSFSGKKVLFIDSYNEGYPWSDGLTKGIKKILDPSGVTLEIVRMDTRTYPSEDAKKAAAAKAVAKITEFKPDIVIAGDDNTAKYVIVNNYKDKDLPVIFTGINWDASEYGFPCKNVTGILEVSPIGALIENMKKYTKGTKVAYITADNNDAQKKEVNSINKKFNLSLNAVYVTTYEDWKKKFVELQKTNDMLIIGPYEGIKDFNKDEALTFAQTSTTILTGAVNDYLAEYAALSMVKLPEELGEWAAQASLDVLGGKKISDIPVVANKRFEIYANMKLLQKLGVQLDVALVKEAKIIK